VIVGVTMVKDEADIIDFTALHLYAEGVDHLIVADNLSRDGTRDILAQLAADYPLTVVDDPELGYYQDRKITGLVHRAGEMGAEWVLPFDADELWYAPGSTISMALRGLPGDVVKAWGWDHIPQADDPDVPNPFGRIVNRRPDTQKLPKVAVRYDPTVRVHMGNHDVDRAGRRIDGALAYRHCGWRSPEQMVRKLRNGADAYRATNMHEMYGTHWRRADNLSDDDILAEWEALLAEDGLVYDPPPVRA